MEIKFPSHSSLESVGHDRLQRCGKVEDEQAVLLAQPDLAPRHAVVGEPARLAVVVPPAAVVDPDLPHPGPLRVQPGPMGMPSSMGLVGVRAFPATASVRAWAGRRPAGGPIGARL